MKKRKSLAILAAALLLVGSASVPSIAATDTRYFASNDPINLTVTENQPTEYANSSALAQKFGSSEYNAFVSTAQNSMYVYQATNDTPHYQITASKHVGSWGPNPFAKDVYWDSSWTVAPPGADNPDAWVVIISPDGSYDTECWQATIVNGKLSCTWGAQGNPHGVSNGDFTPGSAPTGAGISRLAGVITQSDWDNGINHALVYATPDNNANFVWPATRSDGNNYNNGSTVPDDGSMTEGDYIWMDSGCHPSGLTTAQQRIFDALQKYGAYNVDNGASFGFGAEGHATAPGGNGGGWLDMKGLPWASCLHVGNITKGGTPAPTSASPSPTPTQTTPSPTPTTTSPSPTVSPTATPTNSLAVGNVCRVSSTDKRNWWSVANLGDTTVSYTSYVAYSGTNTTGPSGSIKPGQVVSLRTANGGGLHVKYGSSEATASSNATITCN